MEMASAVEEFELEERKRAMDKFVSATNDMMDLGITHDELVQAVYGVLHSRILEKVKRR